MDEGDDDDNDNDDNSALDVEHREQRSRGRGGRDQKNPNPIKTAGSPLHNNGSSFMNAPLSPPSSRMKHQHQPCSSPNAAAAASPSSQSMSKHHGSKSSGSMYEEECENDYHRDLVMYGSRSVMHPLG